MDPVQLLRHVVAGKHLTAEQTEALFAALMDNQLDAAQVAAFLAALATKGEAVPEIVGAARAMRARAARVRVPPGADVIDTCGTGGDGMPIFNVSTCVAIVAAAAGVFVAKHGNRSNARPSGSAEVLEALGVHVDADVPAVERCLRECRVTFLYAPRLHPAMKHAAPVRRALGIRTIFNLVGPLTNPAGVRRQLLGVNRPELVETMAEAAAGLGAERALVVHGSEGLCDLSIAGTSRIGWWDGRAILIQEVAPGVIGLPRTPLDGLRVTSPQHSAAVIREVLAGARGPARDMVVFNAAAALQVAGLAADWAAGAAIAEAVLDDGRALRTLEQWIAVSHEDERREPSS